MTFEILDFPFMLFSGFQTAEGPQIAPFFCFWISFPGIQPVFP